MSETQVSAELYAAVVDDLEHVLEVVMADFVKHQRWRVEQIVRELWPGLSVEGRRSLRLAVEKPIRLRGELSPWDKRGEEA